MNRDSSLSEKIRSIGSELYAAMSGVPPVFDRAGWIGRLMELTMRNEAFRVSLFRFIDLLPSLKTDDLTGRMLKEYFSEEESPEFIKTIAGIASQRGILPHVTAWMVRRGVTTIARQFIAGRDAEEGAGRLAFLTAEGTELSIDLLGEAVLSEKEAQAYAGRYLALLEVLGKQFPEGRRPDLSVKISSFSSLLDPVDWEGSIAAAKDGLRPVLRKARDLGIPVTFDMEQSYFKGLYIAIFLSLLAEEEFREGPSLGISLQAYLKETETDLQELISSARRLDRRITIRLVKGAYWDYETAVSRQRGWPVPVFLSKEETDVSFERLTRRLFENIDVARPAIASHNLRSLSHAIGLAECMGIDRQAFEIQMLYGMAEPLRKAVVERGFRVRVYAPVGELIPGMAYLVRRLLENSSDESFLRKSFAEKEPFDLLIRKPEARPEKPEEEPTDRHFRNEPGLDFSIASNRKAMADALAAVKKEMGGSYPLVIGGRERKTDREIISLNPASPGEVVGRVSSALRAEADAAIAEAFRGREGWRKTSHEERAGYLFMAAGEMRKRRFELAALEVIEAGKGWKEADGDVCEAIDYLEYYGREMVKLSALKSVSSYPGEENEYRYEPKGICAVLSPWNFPLAIATGMVSAALVTGNCVIFKPSGLTPVMGYRLFEVFRSVGLPDGVLQFLPGPGSEVGEHLVTHPDVDLIAFTGSMEVGLRINRLASETVKGQRSVKRVVAEMGGKNAIIVDETADLDEAVRGIIESAFGYQGQKCSACSRVVAVGDIEPELTARLTAAVESLSIGPPEDPGNIIGPVIDEGALKKIRAYIEIGKREGKIILEGTAPEAGYYISPVIFTDVSPDARIATEEIFGPMLVIMQAGDIDEAIAIANSSAYALTGGIFSRSPVNISLARVELRVGNLYINRKITGALVGRQPFGGFGMSGVGSKAGGPDYLLQFMNPVSICENTIRRGFAPVKKGK